MTSRPSRSASIPIPTRTSASSQARNLESIMSIPFIAPSRPRVSTSSSLNFGAGGNRPSSFGTVHAGDDHHGAGSWLGARGTSTSATLNSNIRSTARSLTSASGVPVRANTFEPRVIRADASRSSEVPCQPSTSVAPTRARRTSSTGVRAHSTQRHSSGVPLAPLSSPTSFPRPAYLEHSALRHLLHTEPPADVRKLAGVEDFHSLSSPSPLIDSDDESNVNPPREISTAPPPCQTTSNPTLRLPTRWSEQVRHPMLNVSPDGRDLSFQGASCNGDKDAAAARANYPIPPACGIYYYEVEIISKGQKGHISIGFAGREVKLSRLPGWEKNSWGYHGDDGYVFASENHGQTYGPTYGTGEIVGCGIDFTTNKAFFTKDGVCLGPVFDNVGLGVDLYPSVGLRHAGEHIRVNFGHEPFRFDIDYHVSLQRNAVWGTILSTPLSPALLQGYLEDSKEGIVPDDGKSSAPADQQVRKPINRLVLSYLAHHGYAKTARAFQKQLGRMNNDNPVLAPTTTSADVDMETDEGSPQADDLEHDIEQRTHIVNAVVDGDIDSAMSETREHYPSVLDQDDGLVLFKLKCRKFIELVLEATELKKRLNKKQERQAGLGPAENMDIDGEEHMLSDPSPFPTNGFAHAMGAFVSRETSASPERRNWDTPSTVAQCEAALTKAIGFGQTLTTEYKPKERTEVEAILKRTFSIVAFNDPLEPGCPAAEIAGQEARVALANELNQAILKSQGRPTRPALETLYRHTAVCLAQLGLIGIGSAAFADMQKELLDG